MKSSDKSVQKVDHLIIGGGISGMFVGLELMKRENNNFIILEKENRLGGLCRSFKIGDQSYDIGAHALHHKALESSKEFGEIIDTKALYCQKRSAKVFIYNKFIPHPFQLHLFYAPLKIKLRCLSGYITRPKMVSSNMHDWFLSEFGWNICKYFLFPYNDKAWRTSLKDISSNWRNRIPSGPVNFYKGLLVPGDRNYSSNEYVCYPNTGGFENLFLKIEANIRNRTQTNCEVVKVDLNKKIIVTKSGKIFQYKNLITTLPIDLLFKSLLVKKDRRMINVVNQLDKVSTCLITFLITKNNSNLQRIYIPEKQYYAHRVILNSNSSEYLRSKNNSVVSIEISYKHRQELPSKEKVLNNCQRLLRDLRLIKNNKDIQRYKIEFYKYMYPVQTLSLKKDIVYLKEYLKKFNCYTLGRFGSWSYANVDGIFKEVKDLVKSNLR